ncbi:MAG: ATP-binding protein [Acidibrevibacterium sp.]|uniref:ATP-binding protein n=1 Tax=Acidibrevibacterium sp. TaxID=2606776 RepID=UPI003D05272E
MAGLFGLVWLSLWRDVKRLEAALGAALGEGERPPWPWWPWFRRLADDIERLARGRSEQAATRARLAQAGALIVERLPDPLIVLGADRSVRQANGAARAAFGEDIAAVLRHPTLRAAIDRAYTERATQSVAFSLPVPVQREVRASVVHLLQELPDGGAAIVVLADRSREQAVERMRADFVANASHELRTPLASLIGFIDTLRGPAADDPAAQARFLGIMAEQAARMNRLIDDLLRLSRIEVDEHLPPTSRVDLRALLLRLAAAFEVRLAERGMRLDLALAETLPEIPGDHDQIVQVGQNLLDNALKYGRDGGIVRLAAQATGAPGRPGVAIIVEDDGPGIPRDHLPRLTERFYRVDKGRSRAAGGTGLGLAIVKHVVNRHRGQLTIESEEGHFARFTVWLPAGEPGSPDGDKK